MRFDALPVPKVYIARERHLQEQQHAIKTVVAAAIGIMIFVGLALFVRR
jgi:Na+/H+ antiporter NhaB